MKQRRSLWLHDQPRFAYDRKPPLILINGLAEQAETWFRNARAWSRKFAVHQPNLLRYEGAILHRRIEQDLPISVEYLVERLRSYLDEFVQEDAYCLVANSMGAKIAIVFADRYPGSVSKLVLLGPAGLGGSEPIPIVEGILRNDPASLVGSVFFDAAKVDPGLIAYYRSRFKSRRWKLGLLKTIRGTMEHDVRPTLQGLTLPILLLMGSEDRIICPITARETVRTIANVRYHEIPRCGHAPQIEKAGWVNRIVVQFLNQTSDFRK